MSDHYFESRDHEHPSRTVAKNEFHGVLTSQVLGVKKGDHTGLQGIMNETSEESRFRIFGDIGISRRLSPLIREPPTSCTACFALPLPYGLMHFARRPYYHYQTNWKTIKSKTANLQWRQQAFSCSSGQQQLLEKFRYLIFRCVLIVVVRIDLLSGVAHSLILGCHSVERLVSWFFQYQWSIATQWIQDLSFSWSSFLKIQKTHFQFLLHSLFINRLA